jgi:hypothetical protein
MGLQDRDWYRDEQRRKRKLYWNERSGGTEFDGANIPRRWRWPFRIRPDLPYWAREWVRAALFFGTLGLLYLAWTQVPS